MTIEYPVIDRGFFHLTPNGWFRKDSRPFPEDRLETWAYEMEHPSEDAKESVFLTRTWVLPGLSHDGVRAFRSYFGEAVCPTVGRNVTLECEV